jgi:cation transport protein ChaC
MRSFTEPFAPLSEAARRRSREETMAAGPGDLVWNSAGDLPAFWLFGYGSLMWDATFPHVAARPARLPGWRREMCVWTALARGTPDCPGLALGLLPGGVCDGMAFKIAGGGRDRALEIIWEREMWTDIYRPTWVPLELAGEGEGGPVSALTFTVNRASRQFAGELTAAQTIAHIARPIGERGPCRDYLANTIASLRSLGIEEAHLNALNEMVKSSG